MSNSQPTSDRGQGYPSVPSAAIHKQILDAAETEPEASLEEIATSVSGASIDLVDRVLDTYGDPASESLEPPDEQPGESTGDTETQPEDGPGTAATVEESDGVSVPSLADLTEQQRDVLEAVHRWPSATQRELAQVLDVSCATVNRRVNAIDGFDWTDRETIVQDLFADEVRGGIDRSPAATPEPSTCVETLTARVEALETAVAAERDRPFDLELTHKILHACMVSDRISEAEERAIVEHLLERPFGLPADEPPDTDS